MIYLIKNEAERAIKIGFTSKDDPADRLDNFQTGNSASLRVLGTFPGTREEEKDLHRRFAHLQKNGEWFAEHPEILALLGEAPAEHRCENTEIATQSVKIRILTVGRKQFTNTMLNQLPRASLICWRRVWEELGKINFENILQYEDGNFWGWIRNKEDRWIIFDRREKLFRWGIGFGQETPNECYPSIKILHGRDRNEVDSQTDAFWKSWWSTRVNLDTQLFIGV